MTERIIPEGYTPRFSVYETQKAIEFIKQSFQHNLCAALNLHRVSAPLFVRADTGLNDNLNGVERPVSFDVPAIPGAEFRELTPKSVDRDRHAADVQREVEQFVRSRFLR